MHTGTLTLSRMVATEAWLPGEERGTDITITGHGLVPEGHMLNKNTNARVSDVASLPGLEALLEVASLCNTAALSQDKEGEWVGVGDATSIALTVRACVGVGWGGGFC